MYVLYGPKYQQRKGEVLMCDAPSMKETKQVKFRMNERIVKGELLKSKL